jgi:hypothetical protein
MLIFLYPILYAITIFFEAKGYKIRNEMRYKPAQAYNTFQKFAFIGRFGTLLGMPIIGFSLDNGILIYKLAFVLAISNIMGMLMYIIQGKLYVKLEKEHLLWIIGTFLHAGGMHFLFILSDIFLKYRATILMLSPAINGLGTFLIIFFIEHKLAIEIDNGNSNKEFLRNQFVRIIAHGSASILFFLISFYFYKKGVV